MAEQDTVQIPLTAGQLRERARAVLFQEPGDVRFDVTAGRPSGPSDFDLNPQMWQEADFKEPPRAAAVLVPIVATDQLQVILTQRSNNLPSHPGQIAFPGGKIERSDASPLDAALREAHEEIGLDAGLVEPLGYLDGYLTRTGFHVTPIVGLVAANYTLQLDPREVDRAFEVPFSFLMDAQNHRTDTLPWKGRERAFYAMPYGDDYIWGATAGMIKILHRRLTQI